MRDGISFGSYHFLWLILSLPFNVLIDLIYFLLKRFYRCESPKDYSIPRNAIVYSYHRDLINTLASAETFRAEMQPGPGKGAYLGYHGFFSYVGSLTFWRQSMQCFRYDRRKPKKPFAQIIEWLTHRDGWLFLRTDGGGAYGKVNGSLIKMSLLTGRPLVASRQISDRNITINSHQIPLPGAKISCYWSRPISADELKESKDPLALLQKTIDELAGNAGKVQYVKSEITSGMSLQRSQTR